MFFSFAPEFHCFTAVWITLQQSISERDPSEYEPKADWWLQRMLHSFHRDAACFEGTISHTYAIMECHTFNIIYIYTYCIVYIRAFWFEIVIVSACIYCAPFQEMLLFFVRHVPHALTTFSSRNTMLWGQQLLYKNQILHT